MSELGDLDGDGYDELGLSVLALGGAVQGARDRKAALDHVLRFIVRALAAD